MWGSRLSERTILDRRVTGQCNPISVEEGNNYSKPLGEPECTSQKTNLHGLR